MARVVALIEDLLFGSKVKAALEAAGHDVTLASMSWDASDAPDVLVVDLTVAEPDGVAHVASLDAAGKLEGVRKLGFFAHVEPAVRDRAFAAGFDRVVPRSRMARDASQLVAELA